MTNPRLFINRDLFWPWFFVSGFVAAAVLVGLGGLYGIAWVYGPGWLVDAGWVAFLAIVSAIPPPRPTP
jgi:hypothetical protein